MASSSSIGSACWWLLLLLAMLYIVKPASAFGAGNIASISKLEGHNWRHGDIEDMLKTVAFIKGKKWTSMMVKRVYFGNWLRDYSQAMDVGTLKSLQADTIRILLWVLSFMTFGYATEEFEVTSERLGVYRPEEHIDNPKHYADDQDARQYDPRLRPPIQRIELEIDHQTGMKNYIANDNLGIATSSGYVRHSLSRSIHYGRVYTNGSGGAKGKEADLCEALRCLGQALHTMEDFAAHSNYLELSLREMGHRDVFPHVGHATEMEIHGRRAFPLVTGTFGMVDFLHSVLGEATDHLSQSEVNEVDELNKALASAEEGQAGGGSRGFGEEAGNSAAGLISLLGQVPGAGELSREAEDLQSASAQQQRMNASGGFGGETYGSRATQPPAFQAPPGAPGGPPGPGIPGTNIDPQETIRKIYPILQFRDKVVKSISATIEKIPGLESLVEKITETVTLFVMSLLAPFIRPIIDAVSKQVKAGSGTMVDASGKHQYEPWTDPHCTDPTHSLLSKDHFANMLNEPAGQIATVILQYTAPRVIYAWQHPDIHVDQVVDDVLRAFHHPVLRDRHCEIHNKMFEIVERWARNRPDGGSGLDHLLSSESVRTGKNLTGGAGGPGNSSSHGHGFPAMPTMPTQQTIENKFTGALGSQFGSLLKPFSAMTSMGTSREGGVDFEDEIGQETAYDNTRPPAGPEFAGEQFQPQRPFEDEPYRRDEYPRRDEYEGGGGFNEPGPYGGGPPPSEPYAQGPPPGQQFGYGYGAPEGFQQGYGSYGQYEGQAPPGQYGGYENPPPQGGYYGGPPPGQGQGGYYGGYEEERRW